MYSPFDRTAADKYYQNVRLGEQSDKRRSGEQQCWSFWCFFFVEINYAGAMANSAEQSEAVEPKLFDGFSLLHLPSIFCSSVNSLHSLFSLSYSRGLSKYDKVYTSREFSAFCQVQIYRPIGFYYFIHLIINSHFIIHHV